MTKQTEALRMAIAEMVRAEKVFDDIGLLLIKFGVKPSDISFHKESFLAPSIQACKEALEQPTLTYEDGFAHGYEAHRAEQALAQPAQEPVAWRSEGGMLTEAKLQAQSWVSHGGKAIPLYTHPAPSWQGLSEEEIQQVWYKLEGEIGTHILYGAKLARAIEAKLKEKNP